MWWHRIGDAYAAVEDLILEDIVLWCRRCSRLWSSSVSVAEARTFADNHDMQCHSAEPVVGTSASTIVTATRPVPAVETRTSEEDRVSWRDQAACLGFDVFFSSHVDQRLTRAPLQAQAQAICSTCLVQAECLDFALTTNQQWGTWAGTTPAERKRLRRKKKEAA